uniref:Obscurin like cytoskeletal adaptor 1b n=1 Tax=Sinocyclocheilus rhinocerous TaxID=307959 RepID=A0A673GPK1_9TELE
MPDGGKTIAELAVKGTIVKKLPRRLEVMEAENAAFFVEVEQDDMDICWFKDGLQLQETHQTIIKSFGKTHILVFVNTSYQDSGTITFMAGRSTTSSKLRVKTARHCPPISPVSVQMNTDCLNGAVLSWSPSPNLQNSTKSVYVLERQEVGSQEWQRCLTTETGTSAEILGDSVPCEGDYRFRSIISSILSSSVPGPKIKTPLKNAVVTEGDDAVFSIELSANLIGTWFLNSQQLQDSGRFSMTQSKNQHILRIQQVPNVYDGAEITFIATGVRDSATLQIKVCISKIDRLNFHFMPIVVTNVEWFKDGQELHVEEGVNIQSDGNMRRIVIQSAEYLHSGVYTSPSVSFKEITQEERQKCAMELDPVVLTCELSRPDAPAIWFKDGVAVLQSDNITILSEGTMKRLIIHSAALADAGTYTCQAGDQIMSFSVNIKGKVSLWQKCAMELDPVVLTCELSRPDAPAIWFKDGVAVLQSDNITILSEGTMKRLIIHSAALAEAGTHTCQAGDQTMSFSVNIKRKVSLWFSLTNLTNLTKIAYNECY